ncbi:hypothetical protein LOTGIDRAFT_196436 [Lottia gigantea]|uniref:p53 and DNA damage-regulated protein 1 n=1 Tax=Lottia gigantea TaxID=225164 RepID=V3ZKH2_LOTGI|nr:hypothetical protein LOTGIDRAFT_196436 [Lottia gigantea]ESO84782.1 hypothetical protein LOTGIDRAFT_196436 [Lottia gigantea]
MASVKKETDRLIDHLSVIEEAAEDILSDKQQIIEFDLRRNKTREALRSLQKSNKEKKSWICIGGMFIKMPKKTAVKMLEKDYDELEKEINETRTKLKPKVNKLRDLQNEDDIKGFGLEPLSQSEVRAVERLL